MNYIELICKTSGDGDQDILTALLAEIGYESFVEDSGFLLAYIAEKNFDIKELHALEKRLPDWYGLSYEYNVIADRNWNAEWESNYHPVIIDGNISIRAPFHPKPEGIDYDIIIEPKMSFGTAHHPTTAQMLTLMKNIDFRAKNVLDMGCGTGVLALFAEILGAGNIDAVDNDEWAYTNTLENMQRNHSRNINAYLNDAEFLHDKPAHYDIILANINRNILMNDMALYSRCLKKGGLLLMSGFYHQDKDLLSREAEKHGLISGNFIVERDWSAAQWIAKK